jgi:hypothetical protein
VDASVDSQVYRGISDNAHSVMGIRLTDRRHEFQPQGADISDPSFGDLPHSGRVTSGDWTEPAFHIALGNHRIQRLLPALDTQAECVRDEVQGLT